MAALPGMAMGMGIKRAAPPAAPAPNSKRQASDGSGWICDKCGNHNFETRAYCNLRKCGAPGPWTCPACSNKNFAIRDFCNMKNCNQPRPAPPPGVGPLATQGRGGVGANGAVMQAVNLLQAAGVTNLPGVQDGISKIMASASYGPMGGGLVMGCGGGGCGHMGGHMGGHGGGNKVMDGSWVCVSCGNINFPHRTTCNARMCNKPREEVDGGPAKPGSNSRSIFMPGSWVCSACSNINWPQRETCGMRKCGRPRTEVDAGPATPEMIQSQMQAEAMAPPPPAPLGRPVPEGSWTCDSCGNLNWPQREVCNARNCGKPRMMM
mmetsp:Transcript_54597/g.119512  ORF Transcript_54597/g.119512 Transcript_54597/m.119512 type:complete len:321 (+) Transcript_54597:135-1097(+)